MKKFFCNSFLHILKLAKKSNKLVPNFKCGLTLYWPEVILQECKKYAEKTTLSIFIPRIWHKLHFKLNIKGQISKKFLYLCLTNVIENGEITCRIFMVVSFL